MSKSKHDINNYSYQTYIFRQAQALFQLKKINTMLYYTTNETSKTSPQHVRTNSTYVAPFCMSRDDHARSHVTSHGGKARRGKREH